MNLHSLSTFLYMSLKLSTQELKSGALHWKAAHSKVTSPGQLFLHLLKTELVHFLNLDANNNVSFGHTHRHRYWVDMRVQHAFCKLESSVYVTFTHTMTIMGR